MVRGGQRDGRCDREAPSDTARPAPGAIDDAADPGRVPVRRGRRTRRPDRAHARRPRGGSLDDAAVATARRSIHPRLLRPSLQRSLERRSAVVDDVGEPDGRRRRAAGDARVRALGRGGPLVRRQRRPRIHAPLPQQRVAPRPPRHRRRQPLAAGERAANPRGPRLQPQDRQAREPLPQRPDRAAGVPPGPDPAGRRLQPAYEPVRGGPGDDRGTTRADAARGADLRRPAHAQELDA